MKRNVPETVRSHSVENRNQMPDSIEVNPVADPLEILNHRLEHGDSEPHNRRSEARHADISPDVDHEPRFPSLLEPAENLLDRLGNVRLPKQLSLEESLDVFVRLLREVSEVGYGV